MSAPAPFRHNLFFGPVIGLLLIVAYGAFTVAQNVQEPKPKAETSDTSPAASPKVTSFPVTDLGVEAGEILIELTNSYRQENDLNTLTSNSTLQKACRDYAIVLANNTQFGHEVDETTPAERASEAGYRWQFIAENLLFRENYTEDDARDLAEFTLKQWQESEGHNKNLLASEPSECGVAVFIDFETKVTYVVMLYGHPKDAKQKLVVDPETGETVKKVLE